MQPISMVELTTSKNKGEMKTWKNKDKEDNLVKLDLLSDI